MPRRPRPWMLPVVSVIVVAGWVLWLARDYASSGDSVREPPVLPSASMPAQRDPVPTPAQQRAADPVPADRGSSRSEGRPSSAATPTQRAGEAPAEGAQ